MSWGNPANASLKHGVNNGTIPKEGPKTLPFRVDLTVNQSYEIDLSQQNALEQISFIQGVFIDNKDNSQPLLLTCQGTGQVVNMPPGAQGYVPVLAVLPNKFLVATMGGVVVNLFFYNMPMPAAVWGDGSGAFQFDANGNLLVAEPYLDALISDQGSGDGLNVNILSGGAGGGAGGLPPKVVTSSGAAGVLNLTILAPGPTEKFRVAGVRVTADWNLFDDDGNAGFKSMALIEGTSSSVVATLASWQMNVKPTQTLGFSGWAQVLCPQANDVLFQSPPGFYYEAAQLNTNLTVVMPGFQWDGGLLRVTVYGEIYVP